MGYRLNRLDEPVFIEVSKPLLTEFGIHYRLESCVEQTNCKKLNNVILNSLRWKQEIGHDDLNPLTADRCTSSCCLSAQKSSAHFVQGRICSGTSWVLLEISCNALRGATWDLKSNVFVHDVSSFQGKVLLKLTIKWSEPQFELVVAWAMASSGLTLEDKMYILSYVRDKIWNVYHKNGFKNSLR